MDISNNDNSFLFNILSLIGSLTLISFVLVAIWIALVELSYFWNKRKQQKADMKILDTAEEIYNDFS